MMISITWPIIVGKLFHIYWPLMLLLIHWLVPHWLSIMISNLQLYLSICLNLRLTALRFVMANLRLYLCRSEFPSAKDWRLSTGTPLILMWAVSYSWEQSMWLVLIPDGRFSLTDLIGLAVIVDHPTRLLWTFLLYTGFSFHSIDLLHH